jgi:hypothetical protein
MAENDPQREPTPTQQTKPAKGEPATIPVPKKGDVLAFLEKVAKTPQAKSEVDETRVSD